ncbi:MAG: hypothetical protein AB1648_01595 [Pseudomonadota bacterium]|jgi:hypothetical protein
MRCPICKHGDNCGQPYHDEEMTRELLEQAEQAVSEGVEVDVRRFRRVA